MHLNQPIDKNFSHGGINVVLIVHVVGIWKISVLSLEAEVVNVVSMLCYIVWIEVCRSIFFANSRLKKPTSFEIVVETLKFYFYWSFSASLNA